MNGFPRGLPFRAAFAGQVQHVAFAGQVQHVVQLYCSEMRADKHEHYSEALRQEKLRLLALSPAELRALPECETLKRKIRGVEVAVTIYRHRHREDSWLIVTQAFRRWLRWFSNGGSMFVEGFILKPDDSIVEPGESDLWDYT